MKKFFLIFAGVFACMAGTPADAITINKAAPVAAAETTTSTSAASLLPTVLGIISGVQQLSAQQKELTAECIPTTQEINFVDRMTKEWAKTGAMTADEVRKRLGRQRCSVANGGYRSSVQVAAGTDMDDLICYDYFAGDGNAGMVWENFPKVGLATYCSDGSLSCSDKDRVTVSDIYDIFNLIDFTEKDYYGSDELTMAANLTAKIEKCSYSRLSAKKRQMWGEFLTGTISSLGEPTNTGSIMDAVGSITNSGGFGSSVGSIGALAAQFLGN